MSLLKGAIFSFLMTCSSHLSAKVQVMMTSATIEMDYKRRTEEYTKAIYAIKSYGIEPWVIECMPITHSFLDELSHQVLYPQSNDFSIKNKGVNEMKSIIASIPYLPFDDEDIVIKLTGRYWLYDRELIDLIENTNADYDAYVCYGKHFVGNNHVFTGAYALRWKYFKQLVEGIDLEKAERKWIAVEQIVAEFLKDNHLRIKIVDPLNVEARIFFDGVFMPNYIRRW